MKQQKNELVQTSPDVVAQDAPEPALLIPVDELHEHPEALLFWPNSKAREEDVANICQDILAIGRVKRSLIVCRRGDGGWWVIDGCTRLAGARQAGLERVPCQPMEIAPCDIKDEVYRCNMTRTRFGTGMRVMRYLEMHQDEVLAAAERNADAAATGAMGGRGRKAVSRETSFSAASIAERLKTSKNDVLSGIELLKCLKTKQIPDPWHPARPLQPATDEEFEGVAQAYRIVLAGTPLRRWMAAAAGRAATEGKAKAATNWVNVADRVAASIGPLFEKWATIEWTLHGARLEIEKRIAEAMYKMPDFLRASLVAMIVDTWQPHELKALRKAIDERMKAGGR